MPRIHSIPKRVSHISASAQTPTNTPRMRRYERLINRDGDYYMRHNYRAHWQPMWAIIGLVSCTLLVTFGGWSAIYDLCKVRMIDGKEVSVVDKGDSGFALVAAYLGVIIAYHKSSVY
jgi:amino acid permease